MTHRTWPWYLRYFNDWRRTCRLHLQSGRSCALPTSTTDKSISQSPSQSAVRSAFSPSRNYPLCFREFSFQEEEGYRSRASDSQEQCVDGRSRCIVSPWIFCHFYPLPALRRTYLYFIYNVSGLILGVWELNPVALIIVFLLKYKSLQVLRLYCGQF